MYLYKDLRYFFSLKMKFGASSFCPVTGKQEAQRATFVYLSTTCHLFEEPAKVDIFWTCPQYFFPIYTSKYVKTI